MNNLYTDLAEVYEAMYATFINYKDEYAFYSEIFKKYHKNHLLEIGSGTGNLAAHFSTNGFTYTGLDLSKHMIEIAKRKAADCEFIVGDMRSFQLKKPVEGILMAGRTISYLISNQDVNDSFSSIYQNMKEGGIFCFDCIDANQFIPAIAKEEKVIHKAIHNNKHYLRESIWTLNLEYGMDLKWESIYYNKIENELVNIGEDKAIARTFTKNEIEIFLSLNHFEIKDIIEKETYAFPTFVVVAEKQH